jgi:hypothetical protein
MTKLKELEKRLRDEPDNLGLRVLVAGALHEAGRRDAAVELYRSVAIAYRDQGRPQQAITVCRSILEIAPDDAACHALLSGLLASQPAPRGAPPPAPEPIEPPVLAPRTSPVSRPTPPRLPRPPSSGPEAAEFAEPVRRSIPRGSPPAPPAQPSGSPPPAIRLRRSSGDATPLPLPLPYHEADPTTGSLVRLSRSDLPPSLQEELASYPEIAGIAAAARQISASLIAATRRESDTEELSDEDLAAKFDTGRVLRTGRPRVVPSASVPPPIPRPPTAPVVRAPTSPPVAGAPAPFPESDTAELPEAMRAGVDPDDADDDDPTLPPTPGAAARPTAIDDEKTEPRDLPVRARPPSIAPLTPATGPLAGAFFAPLPPPSRGAVLQRFRRRIVPAGTVVIRRGDIDHDLVVVVRGRLELHAERPDGARIALGAFGPGEFAGEASLLAQTPAAADIVAGLDAALLVLAAEDFRDVTRAFPALRAELEAVAERRAQGHAPG